MKTHTNHSTEPAIKTKVHPQPEELQRMIWAEIEIKLRAYMKSLMEELLEQKITDYLGAFWHERSPIRKGYRNGSYARSLGTFYGTIDDVNVPRLRAGSYDTDLFDRYQRRAGTIDQAIGTLFLNGVSTRKLHWIAKELMGTDVSASTVSNIAAVISEKELQQFQNKPLQDEYRFLFLDGIVQKVREIGVKKGVLLCAVGIKHDGIKEIIGGRLAESESEKEWTSFLMDIKTRGLSGKTLKLITTDGASGLIAAIKSVYPFQKRQRCIAHKMRNVATKMKRAHQPVCLPGAKAVFAAPSRTEAIRRFKEWKEKWEPYEESAVRCLEKDLYECLTYYDFEKSVWKKIRTTNIIERSFREIRRRTRPMSIALSPDATERLYAGISKGLNRNFGLSPIEFTHKS
jgi:putative transposase